MIDRCCWWHCFWPLKQVAPALVSISVLSKYIWGAKGAEQGLWLPKLPQESLIKHVIWEGNVRKWNLRNSLGFYVLFLNFMQSIVHVQLVAAISSTHCTGVWAPSNIYQMEIRTFLCICNNIPVFKLRIAIYCKYRAYTGTYGWKFLLPAVHSICLHCISLSCAGIWSKGVL